MPKLRSLSGMEIRQILEAHGFVFVRQTGSHMMMRGQVAGGNITVPVPRHREVALGTLGSIIRLSELSRELFEA